MTRRLDESNIVDYLHNFKKSCIRQTKHSTFQHKDRELYFKDSNKLLNEKEPKSQTTRS